MSIVIAIILVTLTGLLCSVMLVVASHFMMVPTNEKEEKLRNCLPVLIVEHVGIQDVIVMLRHLLRMKQ